MTDSELRALIVNMLVKARGGSQQKWRRAVGAVQIYSLATHPHCNWELRTSGTPAEVAAVEDILDLVRDAQPHVTRG